MWRRSLDVLDLQAVASVQENGDLQLHRGRTPADDEDGKEGAMFAGRVVAFDRVAGNVSVLFDEVTASGAVDQEDYAWKSEDIQWLMPPTVSRPATIQEAIGYNVEVNRAQSDAEAYRAARGTVVNIDEAQNKVRVIYAPPPGELFGFRRASSERGRARAPLESAPR